MANPQCFFDISIGGITQGRIVFELVLFILMWSLVILALKQLRISALYAQVIAVDAKNRRKGGGSQRKAPALSQEQVSPRY